MNVLPDVSVAVQPVAEDWYKDAIVYQLHVKAFADSNDDGIGDFNGLTQRLDYLQDLGVTTLWLLPFYPSPGRDDGYDIADYRRINPAFGTMQDFRRFMVEAKRRGLRIITELVVNHTSDQHPWFRRARRSAPTSTARNWYVWSDSDQRYAGTRIIFTDTEKSNWAWDPEAGAYYWHRFFSHQPDLNFANPQVFAAIVRVMRRWIDTGVDGFRLDAIPYLCEREGTNNENLPETHDVIRRLRAEVESYAPGTVLLAEANQWPEDVSAYFGQGDECHMAYHFPLMPRIYMAIAQEDRFPITDILRQTPDIPANCQWALFLRNHDELTLEMVTDVERDYLWSTYAADPRARINLGIRRRLAPLMDNDRRKIELMNSLLLSFPGTPILYYGDELGMGDNIYLGDRNSVRTPMQWTPDRNGGFSRCDPAKLFLPPIMDAVYGFHAINVEAQSRSLSSLLSWTKRMIAVRKSSRVFGRGSLSFIRAPNRAVLAYTREHAGEVILCVANLSRSAQSVDLDLSPWRGRIAFEMIGRTRFRQIGEQPFAVTLAPYGFFWLELKEPADGASEVTSPLPEWITLVFSDGWRSLTAGRMRQLLERDVLPPFLAARRWFAHKDAGPPTVTVAAGVPLTHGSEDSVLALVDVAAGREVARYALPLAVRWSRFDRMSEPAKAAVIAPVRRAHREGVLVDAASDRDVIDAIVRQIHQDVDTSAEGQALAFRATRRFAAMPLPLVENVRAAGGEQSNSTVLVNGALVLKFYRRIDRGPNPEFEMGRFLTDVAQFANTPALLGTVELTDAAGTAALAILHEQVENQGDGWAFTTAYLDRALDEERLLGADASPEADRHTAFINRIQRIGQRVGEMHAALASRPDIPAFAPEPVTASDLSEWTGALAASASDTLRKLDQSRHRLDPAALGPVEFLLAQHHAVLGRIGALLPREIDADKIRQHGDLHLGQILMVKDDIFIIDFEGEPGRPRDQRSRKVAAARDVAGMVRSLDYAATTALNRLVAGAPEERARLEHFLDRWREQATAALYAGARSAAGDTRLWPREEAAAQQLLRIFVIEKAVYEIDYELSNRPDWVSVPVAGLVRALFDRAEGAS